MNRRNFAKIAGLGTMAIYSMPAVAKNQMENSAKIPIGICNHSLRSMRPNAIQLVEYAIEKNLDSVLFNTLNSFESIDSKHLSKIKKLAARNNISIFIGAGGISEKSLTFSSKYGNAKELLIEGIRVAKALGSPIVGCRIGDINDRYSEGGIEAHIEEVVKVMKSVSSQALDAGIKFAFENHAGDLRSEELLELITATGTDICGALFDPANALWALEDPTSAFQKLGKNILCTSVRDVMAWETKEGAIFQGMAIGEGLMNYTKLASSLNNLCPGVPFHIETISNSARPIPFLKSDFWKGFPNLSAAKIIDFIKFIKKGQPQILIDPPLGKSKKEFNIELQQAEFLKSVNYLRKNCNAGLKT